MAIYKSKRKYYKYVLQDWVQPVLTSETSYGIVTASSYRSSIQSPYKAVDGVKSGGGSNALGWITTSSTGWWKWELPVKLSISSIKYYNTYATLSSAVTGQFFIDEGITPLTESFSTSSASWASYTLPSINTSLTNVIYFKKTAGNDFSGIGEIEITAQEEVIVESTADDYDYTVVEPDKIQDLYKSTWRKYYKYGTELDATVVGSFAKIDKGVASGFSTSQYLNMLELFRPENNTWERVICLTTGSDISSHQYLDSINTLSNQFAGFKYSLENGKIGIYISSNGSSWNIANNPTTSFTFLPNTKYYIKGLFNGTEYKVQVSTTGEFSGEESTAVAISSTLSIYQGSTTLDSIGVQGSTHSSPFLGSIDLSQSYININGERWWSGDSYTKVGSWIDDGSIGVFSASNYTRLPFTFEGGSYNNWELVTKIKVNSYSSGPAILCVNSSYGIFNYAIRTDGRVQLALSTNTDSFNICNDTGEKVLDLNTWYWYKAEFTGTAYNVYWSTDGKAWNLDSSVQNSTKLGNISALNFGIRTKLNDQILDGYIDMQETYFKANGVDVWHGTKAIETTPEDADYSSVPAKQIVAAYKTGKRKYYKYPFEDNELPVLTENGVMGGDSFAVESSSNIDNAYKAFAGNDKWMSEAYDTAPQWLTFYNPKAFKLNKIKITYGNTESYYYAKGIYIQGSNNNIDWDNLYDYTASSRVTEITCKVDSKAAYKYHRIYVYSRAYYDTQNCYAWVGVAEIDGCIESTPSDYDYYEIPNQLVYDYVKQYLTNADWTAVKSSSSGGNVWGEDSSHHDYYSGSTSDTFTFNTVQPKGKWHLTFRGWQQFNFRHNSFIVTITYEDGTTEQVWNSVSILPNGATADTDYTIPLIMTKKWKTINVYNAGGRVNSVNCYGGLGRHRLLWRGSEQQ